MALVSSAKCAPSFFILAAAVICCITWVIVWNDNPRVAQDDLSEKEPSSRAGRHVAKHADKSSRREERLPDAKSVMSATIAPDWHGQEEVITILRNASVTYSTSAVPIIEEYLLSEDATIRTEALSAMVHLGEASGAGALRKAAHKLKDPSESKEFLEMANYLELPSASLGQP